jgi:SAM-dependent methyltransferase
VDAAPQLLEVARQRARTENLEVDFREGDLLDLPVNDDAVDVVLSVLGVVFASDPLLAFREITRVVRRGGRVLISAWVPTGPIDAMLSAAAALGRVVQARPPARFPWSDEAAVLTGGIRRSRATAPDGVSVRPILERANAAAEAKKQP